ncbi:hypothetical protein MT418_006507 [Batrachochytrium dendrobatidis]
MPVEQFMLQYHTLSTTTKKQLLIISAIKYHQTICTFSWSRFTLFTLQERNSPITRAVLSSSRGASANLPHPDANAIATEILTADPSIAIPIENDQQKAIEQ